ncbi:MAG: hypothetical protein LBP50_05375 [Tannerella sp.]|jgi:hypothetical protein|nr:hypothetical protein [Tannerella sp.]
MMTRKFIWGAFLLSGLTFFLHAQQTMEEVVYLKDGSVIRGMIVEQVPNQSLKIRTADGSLFILEMKEVKKLTKEPVAGRRNALRHRPAAETPEKPSAGRYSAAVQIAGLGYQELLSSTGLIYQETSFICGYRHRHFLFLGGGVGLEHMAGDFRDSYNLRIPVFVTVKLNMNRRRVSPWIQLEVGKRFNANDYFQDGLFVCPKAGIDFNLGAGKRTALFLSVSLLEYGNMPSFYYRSESSDPDYYENEFYLRTGIHFGCRF